MQTLIIGIVAYAMFVAAAVVITDVFDDYFF